MALGSSNGKVGTVAAQAVAAIAAVELPHGQWLDVIEILLGFVNNQTNNSLRVATLQAIGFICETIVCTCLFLFCCVRSPISPALSTET